MTAATKIDARLHRQALAIGDAAQARVAKATARPLGPRGSLASEVAALYTERAGFATLEDAEVAAAPAPEPLESEAAREVLAGARHALREVMRAIGEGSP